MTIPKTVPSISKEEIPTRELRTLDYDLARFSKLPTLESLNLQAEPFVATAPKTSGKKVGNTSLVFSYVKLAETVQDVINGKIEDLLFYEGIPERFARKYRQHLSDVNTKYHESVQQMFSASGSAGFRKPPGTLERALNKVELQRTKELVSSDGDLTTADRSLSSYYQQEVKEIIDAINFAIQSANRVEVILFDSHRHLKALTFEAADTIAKNLHREYELSIQEYNSQLDLFRIQMQASLNESRDKILVLSEYELKLREKVLNKQDKALHQQLYRIALDYMSVETERVLSSIDLLEIQAEEERTKILKYKAEVERFSALIGLNVAEYRSYAANVRKELAQLTRYRAETRAAEADLQAEEAETSLNRVKGKADIDIARANLETVRAKLDKSESDLRNLLFAGETIKANYDVTLLQYAEVLREWFTKSKDENRTDTRKDRDATEDVLRDTEDDTQISVNDILVGAFRIRTKNIAEITAKNTEIRTEIQTNTDLTSTIIEELV